MAVKSYRELIVWRQGIDLVKQVYVLVNRFPKHETYALGDQLRRSVVSIPFNIAEGQGRQHTAEFRQFLYNALGSAAEVDTHIILACELGYISETEMRDFENRITEIRKMTYTLISHLPTTHRPLTTE